VKAAIGDGMIDRAVAVLRGSGREFIITSLSNPTDRQERGEVRIREMYLDVTEHGVVEVVARFTVVPLPAHDFGWRRDPTTHLRTPAALERSLCHIETFPAHEFFLTTDRGRVTCRRCLDLIERMPAPCQCGRGPFAAPEMHSPNCVRAMMGLPPVT
jgi:hypothetical protein